MAHRPPPRPLPPHGGRGGTATPVAASWPPRLPSWLRENRAQVQRVLRLRAAGDPEAWRLWDAVHMLALALDTLATAPDREEDAVPTAWGLACWLSERLPAPTATRPPASAALLDSDGDTTTLIAVCAGAAAALVADLTAPADADATRLLADVSTTVASLTPLLARWDQQVPRIAELTRLLHDLAEPPTT